MIRLLHGLSVAGIGTRCETDYLIQLDIPPTTPSISQVRTCHDEEDHGAQSREWSSAGMRGWGEREIPEKTRQPTASSGTIPLVKTRSDPENWKIRDFNDLQARIYSLMYRYADVNIHFEDVSQITSICTRTRTPSHNSLHILHFEQIRTRTPSHNSLHTLRLEQIHTRTPSHNSLHTLRLEQIHTRTPSHNSLHTLYLEQIHTRTPSHNSLHTLHLEQIHTRTPSHNSLHTLRLEQIHTRTPSHNSLHTLYLEQIHTRTPSHNSMHTLHLEQIHTHTTSHNSLHTLHFEQIHTRTPSHNSLHTLRSCKRNVCQHAELSSEHAILCGRGRGIGRRIAASVRSFELIN
ncbi:hypothetical protein PR048_015528 [Dryococelus australis]|uniref:Uncharacterized protein n=1 Tax=Dryococelus australis TaxID=614101 RepID=A0ABQ9HHG0_9NEOP|nr:hypothetical protein PR048_015528 [Dryococelus australis]